MTKNLSAEHQAQEWYAKYRVKHEPHLAESDLWYPIWQMLAIASEIHDKNGPLDLVNEAEVKIERITTISVSLQSRKNPVFPQSIVTEIEQVALNFARTRSLPPFNP